MNLHKVGIVIPTLNAGPNFESLLENFKSLPIKNFRKLIIDSSSNDQTADISVQKGWEIEVIERKDFNHGRTRQFAVDLLSDCDLLFFLTQDVVITNPNVIDLLISPFNDQTIGAVCGRQLPHLNANPLATHLRIFNYSNESCIKDFKDIKKNGLKTAFMSNSFAAYRRKALLEVGGFPKNIIFGEDMYVAAKMILSKWRLSYEANAYCYHSHNYTLLEEFRRYFDVGVFYNRESWLNDNFRGGGPEGIRYVKSELKYLIRNNFFWIPRSIFSIFFKFVAYKLGKNEKMLPVSFKKMISMNKTFWVI